MCNQCLSPLKFSNPVDGEMYSIQHYVIKFVNDLRQFGGFLWVFRLLGDYVYRIYSIECEIKDTKDTHSSVSYLNIHLEIERKNRLRTKFTTAILFQFSHSEFPIHMYQHSRIHASLLIRYSRACGFYHDYLDRRLLWTLNQLNQTFLVIKLKWPVRKFYGGFHDLVNRYGNVCPREQ